jgi:hypothetical protein
MKQRKKETRTHRTVREWVERQRPGYDPNKHLVMLNYKPVDNLDIPFHPLANIEVKDR